MFCFYFWKENADQARFFRAPVYWLKKTILTCRLKIGPQLGISKNLQVAIRLENQCSHVEKKLTSNWKMKEIVIINFTSFWLQKPEYTSFELRANNLSKVSSGFKSQQRFMQEN